MGRPLGLRQRGKSWEMRVRVPKRLHGLLPKEKVRSFGSISYADACRLGWAARADLEKEFEAAEVKLGLAARRLLLPIPPSFTEAELEDAARRYLSEREAATNSIPLDADAQAQARESVWDDAYHAERPGALDDAGFHALAERFAERQGYRLPIGAARYPFLQAIQTALVEHYDRLGARFDGAPVATINPAFTGVSASSDGPSCVTLAEAVGMYIAAPERSANANSSRKMDRSRLGTLRDILGGDRLVSSITKADLRAYVEQLIMLPSNYSKRFPGMMPSDAIMAGKKVGTQTLSATSIERGVQAAKSLFAWLEREDEIAANPAQHLKAPKAPSKSSRRSFEIQEMRALLTATAARDGRRQDWTYWATRIAMLQGLRFTEPLGLKADDLVCVNGIWAFRIRPNEYRSLKTEETEREVPVHPKLIQLGILELLAEKRAEERLIADAPWSLTTGFNAAQKHMGRVVRRHVSSDRDLTFHSLRHNFRDAMRDGGFPQSVEEKLGGWKSGASSAMNGYGRGHKLATLLDWIRKVTYGETVIE